MTPSKKTLHPYWTTMGRLERTIADLNRLSKRLSKLIPTVERYWYADQELEKLNNPEDEDETTES